MVSGEPAALAAYSNRGAGTLLRIVWDKLAAGISVSFDNAKSDGDFYMTRTGSAIEFIRADHQEPAFAGSRPYYMRTDWREVCAGSLGTEFSRYRILFGQEEVGEFCYAVMKSRLFGKRLISLPFSDGNGLFLYPGRDLGLREERELLDSLVCFLDRQADAQGLDYIELRGDVPLGAIASDGYFTRHLPYVSFILNLSVGYAAVARGYSRNIVENLRKADGCVNIAEYKSSAMADDLYWIYVAQMRKFGSPPLPIEYFSGLLASGLARIFVAQVNARTAGFLMVLVCGNRMLAEINASLEEFDSYYPKVLLFDHSIQSACNAGMAEFDFMRTRRSSGVYQHKKKWGGAEKPIPYYLRPRGSRLPKIIDPDQSRYSLPRFVFKCLPLSVLAYAGPTMRSWIGK